MSTPTRSIVRLSALGLGALLIGLPGTAARAAEPTTASDAEAMAQDARKEADYYRSLGGVGYKTGLEQREEADAARYSAMAEKLAAPTAATPAPSSEADQYGAVAAHHRAMGGAAYKTGLVQSAETQQQKAEAATGTAPAPTQEASPNCPPIKPAILAPDCNQ